MKLKALLTAFALLAPLCFMAQAMNPVKWTATYADLPNNEGLITITATIDKHWHIYSQRLASDGPIATSFTFAPNSHFSLQGKTEEEGAKEEYDKAFDAKLSTFEGSAVFKQKIRRSGTAGFTTTIKLEYMTCNDMQCLPPKTVELSVTAAGKK